jgi:hypothetical protein
MNLFNRVVLVILLIVLLGATLFSLLVPLTVLNLVRGFLDQIETAVPFYDILSGAYWAFLGVGLLIVLLCVLLLWLELRRPRYRIVQVSDGDGRIMEVGVKAITQRLQSELSALADVSRVKAKVLSRGKKVDVVLDTQVHPAVDLPTKTSEITQLTRDLIEQQIGAGVGKVRVNIQYGPATPRAVPEPPPVEEPDIVAEPELAPIGGLAEPVLPLAPAASESAPAAEPELPSEPPEGEDPLVSADSLGDAGESGEEPPDVV